MPSNFFPEYRFRLKAKISESGFRNLTEFSKAAGLHISQTSKIVTGREIPTPGIAERMANALNISVKEFGTLFAGK